MWSSGAIDDSWRHKGGEYAHGLDRVELEGNGPIEELEAKGKKD